MLRKVMLGGWLGRKFGKEYKFDVSSAAEAVHALCCQVKGFKEYMQQGKGRDKLFKVVVNDRQLFKPEETMVFQSEGDIKIVPVIKASGGLFNFIVGAILTAVGVFTGQPYLTAAGIGMMIGGVAALLIKPPKTEAPDESKENRSYIFNGAVNVTQQGQPVPFGYGRMRIGSQVISTSITTSDV